MRIGGVRGLAVGLVFATLLVGCGDNDDGGTETAQGSPAAESPAATVQVADSDLGSILIDPSGSPVT